MAALSVVRLLFLVVAVALPLFAAYWVVRLGVRHGMQDVERARREQVVIPPRP